jgi:hypothetical protein
MKVFTRKQWKQMTLEKTALLNMDLHRRLEKMIYKEMEIGD